MKDSSFSYFMHSTVYRMFWPVIGSSATGTMPLTTQILHTATQWRATPQIINRNMQNLYSYSSLCDAFKS